MTPPAAPPPRRAPALLKLILGLMVSLYRLTNGAIGGRMGPNPVLLLTTTGRKSGKPHTVPLSYFEDGQLRFLVASNGGQDRPPAWYLNLTANPRVEIQIKGDRKTVTATTASPAERELLWQRVIARAPSYDAYRRKTTRVIPIVLLRDVP
jgi:deazaflavin-dependent oxidoreductase (nitroreductase family)